MAFAGERGEEALLDRKLAGGEYVGSRGDSFFSRMQRCPTRDQPRQDEERGE